MQDLGLLNLVALVLAHFQFLLHVVCHVSGIVIWIYFRNIRAYEKFN